MMIITCRVPNSSRRHTNSKKRRKAKDVRQSRIKRHKDSCSHKSRKNKYDKAKKNSCRTLSKVVLIGLNTVLKTVSMTRDEWYESIRKRKAPVPIKLIPSPLWDAKAVSKWLRKG